MFYWWVDGVGFSVRNDERHCVLVILGVTIERKKEFTQFGNHGGKKILNSV